LGPHFPGEEGKPGDIVLCEMRHAARSISLSLAISMILIPQPTFFLYSSLDFFKTVIDIQLKHRIGKQLEKKRKLILPSWKISSKFL
jgi:hypothetical protein